MEVLGDHFLVHVSLFHSTNTEEVHSKEEGYSPNNFQQPSPTI